MEIEEWLSRGLGEMQVCHHEMGLLLQMMERSCTQPSLSGFTVPATATAVLEEVVRYCYSVRMAWLSYASQIATWIGPDGQLVEASAKLWKP